MSRRNATSPKWTEGETLFLRRHYAERGPSWCARQPALQGRTVQAIRNRALYLGLHHGHPSQWSDGEDMVLRRYYRAGGLSACRDRLTGRTKNAIHNRAIRLGLSRA